MNITERELSRGTPVDTRRRGTAFHRRRIVTIAAGFAVLAASGALYWYWSQGPDPARVARPAARAAVPVSVAVASRRDLPVYLTGLGTVQASFTGRPGLALRTDATIASLRIAPARLANVWSFHIGTALR